MSEVVQDPGEITTEVPADEPETSDVPDEPDEETEDQAETPPDEPPADPAPELGMTERELEELQKKLERSATTWRNRVSELLGEAAQVLVPCELCDPTIPGFHWPVDAAHPQNDLQAHLFDVLRNPAAPDYLQAQHVRRCGTCDGWGVVLSGSRVASKEKVKCPTCGGQGFQGPGATVQTEQPQNGEVVVDFPEDVAPLVEADADIWGSPRLLDDGQENPNYGKMPQYKIPGLP